MVTALIKGVSLILFLASALSTLYALLRLPLMDRVPNVNPLAIVAGLICSTVILVITGWYLTVMS